MLIGEVLRRQGYSVQETGGQGADGGVDLIVRRDNERYLVQCKHWRATQVGVPVVRELYGAMAAEGAVGGFVVTSGTFSQPAREFAKGRNLHLIDGATLKEWLDTPKKPPMPQPAMTTNARVEPLVETKRKQNPPPAPTLTPQPQPDPLPAPEPHAPACPHCREPMQIRVARAGRNAGGQFWGCASYPKCRGIRPIFATGTASNR